MERSRSVAPSYNGLHRSKLTKYCIIRKCEMIFFLYSAQTLRMLRSVCELGPLRCAISATEMQETCNPCTRYAVRMSASALQASAPSHHAAIFQHLVLRAPCMQELFCQLSLRYIGCLTRAIKTRRFIGFAVFLSALIIDVKMRRSQLMRFAKRLYVASCTRMQEGYIALPQAPPLAKTRSSSPSVAATHAQDEDCTRGGSL